MVLALTRPDCTWMLLVSDRLVAPLLRTLSTRSRCKVWFRENPVSSIEKLGRLENHLHDMLVTMPSSTARWFVRYVEYVHGWKPGSLGGSFNFYVAYE
jgi:hypothetical protein